MDPIRKEIVAWVGSQVLPHEADVRRWLNKRLSNPSEVDDIVQEAYCRLAALDSVAHIENGRAYFFMTARSIVAQRVRRARIVRIDSVSEMDALNIVEDEPSPERIAGARRELERVRRLIEALPDGCRRIFVLRRIDGVPQKEIARRLGVTENTVEAQAVRGLKLILKALADGEGREKEPRASRGLRAHDRYSTRAR